MLSFRQKRLGSADMTRHYHPAHRRQAIQRAQALLARPILVMDTETTGLGKADQIIEIAIIDQNGAEKLLQRVKPSIPIPPAASRVHGITDKHVENAPDFRAIYVRLSVLLAGQVALAYNMDFDWRMLAQTAAAFNLPEPRAAKRDCAMKLYARFKGERKPGGRSYKWHKLSDAARREGLTVADVHSSLGDARMTLALLRKMAEAR